MKDMLIKLLPIILIFVMGAILIIWDIIEERRKTRWHLPNKDELKQLYKELKHGRTI
jgi:hypothetical protein